MEGASPDHDTLALSLDGLLCQPVTFFAVMQGYAMERSKIHHRDLLVIQPEEVYRIGQIVLVLAGHQAVVRKLERATSGSYELVASHPKIPPLPFNEDCIIRGRVIASITLLARPKIPLPVVS